MPSPYTPASPGASPHLVERIALPDLALLVGIVHGKQAGPMEVQVGVEIRGTEGVDLASGVLRNVAVAQVLADHRPVLRFHQAVVVGMTRPGFGEFDAQLVEHPGYPVVDVLRTVVSVKAKDPEREAVQQRLDDGK